MIDIRDGETFTAYSERKDREFYALMSAGLRGQATIRECAQGLADAIDASILAKYEVNPRGRTRPTNQE